MMILAVVSFASSVRSRHHHLKTAAFFIAIFGTLICSVMLLYELLSSPSWIMMAGYGIEALFWALPLIGYTAGAKLRHRRNWISGSTIPRSLF